MTNEDLIIKPEHFKNILKSQGQFDGQAIYNKTPTIKSRVEILDTDQFQEPIIITNVRIKDLVIKGGTFLDRLFIQFVEIKNLKIFGGNFHGPIDIFNSKIHDLIINGGVFGEEFSLENSSIEQIYFFGGKFESRLHFQGKSLNVNDIHFNGGSFYKSIEITTGNFDSITVSGGNYQEFDINGGSINHFKLFGGKMIELNVGTISKGKLQVKNIDIESSITYKVIIQDLKGLKGVFLHCLIQNDGLLTITNLKTTNFHIRSLENQGKIILENIRPNRRGTGDFTIENSSMGVTTFNNVSWDSYNKLLFGSSQLNQIETYGEHIPCPEEYSGTLYMKEGKTSDYEYYDRQDNFYNNLKIAMSSQGNRERENLYYAASLDAKLKALWIDKSNWSNILSLFFHKVSSNYGQNWLLSALWLFGIGLVFYYPYFISSPDYAFGFNLTLLPHFLGKYCEFVLPFHTVDFLYDDPGGWIILDFVSRIIIGFFIYQLITAFRKFGRK